MQSLEKQIGGWHYKNMTIQPIEFSYRNQLNPLAFSIVKYLSRYHAKDGKKDLQKTLHCIEMWEEFVGRQYFGWQSENPTTLRAATVEYCEVNALGSNETQVLCLLLSTKFPHFKDAKRFMHDMIAEYVD